MKIVFALLLITFSIAAPSQIGKQGNWYYVHSQESVLHYAAVISSENNNIIYPYKKIAVADIVIKNLSMGNHGNEVMLTFYWEDLMATSKPLGKGTIRLKFDGNEPTDYLIIPSFGKSKSQLFILEADEVINKLKSSKRLLIEVSIRGKGNKTLEFNTSQFTWDH
ncbi:MAG: hypothetical protein Q8L07_11490 [Sediminibacterium sp.]|nr:hypothetical protein [Sediminibacterium sp.]